jgi:KTSC domain
MPRPNLTPSRLKAMRAAAEQRRLAGIAAQRSQAQAQRDARQARRDRVQESRDVHQAAGQVAGRGVFSRFFSPPPPAVQAPVEADVPEPDEPWLVMHEVSSSHLKAVGYYEAGKFLFISFNPRGHFPEQTYQYANVPKSVYDGLMAASSKGTYFWSNIRGRKPPGPYRYKLISVGPFSPEVLGRGYRGPAYATHFVLWQEESARVRAGQRKYVGRLAEVLGHKTMTQPELGPLHREENLGVELKFGPTGPATPTKPQGGFRSFLQSLRSKFKGT